VSYYLPWFTRILLISYHLSCLYHTKNASNCC